MVIRKASEKDIAGINRLLGQVLAVHHNGRPDLFKEGAKKYTDAQLKEILEDEKRTVFVAVDGEAVLGYAFCIFQQAVNSNILTNVKTLYLDDLCVDENVRGRHIGTTLFGHVRAFAKESGCYNLTLNVWACNEGAMKFYEKCGLKPQKTMLETVL